MNGRLRSYTHAFTEFIPDQLEPGVLYVSLEYATCVHLCACGCGSEVVTPLSPVDYTVSFDGVSVSLDPSVGNWSYPCSSHYVLRGGRVRWCAPWTPEQIAAGRARTAARRAALGATPGSVPTPSRPPATVPSRRRRWWLWRRC